jgi:hypothetical protein
MRKSVLALAGVLALTSLSFTTEGFAQHRGAFSGGGGGRPGGVGIGGGGMGGGAFRAGGAGGMGGGAFRAGGVGWRCLAASRYVALVLESIAAGYVAFAPASIEAWPYVASVLECVTT